MSSSLDALLRRMGFASRREFQGRIHHLIVEEDREFCKMHFMLWQERTSKSIAWVLGHKTQNDKAQLEIKPAVDFKEMAGYVGEERVVGIS